MSEFTIGKAQQSLRSPEAMREFKSTKLEGATPSEGGSFADTLNNAIDKVNKVQSEADVKMQELASGKTNNIPEVMMAVEKADIAMKLMMSVRNKVIDAYQEIMKMQV